MSCLGAKVKWRLQYACRSGLCRSHWSCVQLATNIHLLQVVPLIAAKPCGSHADEAYSITELARNSRIPPPLPPFPWLCQFIISRDAVHQRLHTSSHRKSYASSAGLAHAFVQLICPSALDLVGFKCVKSCQGDGPVPHARLSCNLKPSYPAVTDAIASMGKP